MIFIQHTDSGITGMNRRHMGPKIYMSQVSYLTTETKYRIKGKRTNYNLASVSYGV